MLRLGPKIPSVFNDGRCGYLNGDLIKEKNVSPENVAKLKFSHAFKDLLEHYMASTDDPAKIAIYGRIWRSLIFYQQVLWGFDKDERMHAWDEIPHCICNQYRGFNKHPHVDCPVHGWMVKSS